MNWRQARLWRSARKVAAGLVAFVPAARALATGVPDVVQKHVRGRVVEAARGLLVVETEERGQLVLVQPSGAEAPGGQSPHDLPVEIGDQIVAWVKPRRRGVFEIEQLWVNWITLRGTATIRDETTFDLRVDSGELAGRCIAVRWNAGTVMTTARDAVAASSGPLTPIEGQRVQIAGRKLKDGAVLAAQIYLHPLPGP